MGGTFRNSTTCNFCSQGTDRISTAVLPDSLLKTNIWLLRVITCVVLTEKEYARYTFSSRTNSNLFTLNNILAMCDIDAHIRKHVAFRDACARKVHTRRRCCRSWSLPNYVALLSNRSTCHNITHQDITKVRAYSYCRFLVDHWV